MATGTRPRDWADVDYYAVLGIDEDADDESIGRAFRALAKQLHPDAGATERDVERFKEVAGAYEVLGDRKIRREYDRVRAEIATARAERVAYGFRPHVADPFATSDFPQGRPMPAFAARRVRPRRGFTRRRAWLAAIGGLVIFAGGVVVGLVTLSLHNADARIHDDTIAAHVEHVDVGGQHMISFVAEDGTKVQVPAPDLGEQGHSDVVRYYPDDPQHVVVDKDTVGRDITLAIVAIKLLVSGPILTGLGLRRLHQLGFVATSVR